MNKSARKILLLSAVITASASIMIVIELAWILLLAAFIAVRTARPSDEGADKPKGIKEASVSLRSRLFLTHCGQGGNSCHAGAE